MDKWLRRYPNMMVDIAARVPELGRHKVAQLRKLFTKHRKRIIFGSDLVVERYLVLGSGGKGPSPSDKDAQRFFDTHWRWLESRDKNFKHMTPIQGNWKINAIGLAKPALQDLYFGNAKQLLNIK